MDGLRPSTKSRRDVIIVIIMNGTKTINQDTTPKPIWQSKLRATVNTIMTRNFRNAVLYKLLKMSIMICVIENTTYNMAGAHSLFNCI